jgi:hypothetical protein
MLTSGIILGILHEQVSFIVVSDTESPQRRVLEVKWYWDVRITKKKQTSRESATMLLYYGTL